MSHIEEVASIRGRQLALIKLLSSEDALAVLRSLPVTIEEEHDIIADIQQRHVLMTELERKTNG